MTDREVLKAVIKKFEEAESRMDYIADMNLCPVCLECVPKNYKLWDLNDICKKCLK